MISVYSAELEELELLLEELELLELELGLVELELLLEELELLELGLVELLELDESDPLNAPTSPKVGALNCS